MRLKKLPVIFLLLLSPFCFAQEKDKEPGTLSVIEANMKCYYSQVLGFDVKNVWDNQVFDIVADWMHTPYLYAGKNEDGIDCSGFVNMVVKKVTGNIAGINSLDMYNNSKHISRNRLKPGDLVFFKTRGKRVSHVGIYLGDDKFAHSSTSNGVIVSDLNEEYYKKRFVKGGRIALTGAHAKG